MPAYEHERVGSALRPASKGRGRQRDGRRSGAVYRLDPERIVKVYHSASSTLDKIQESRKAAQKLLVAGIPVAIAFEVVRVGESYGLIFELLDCTTIGQIVHRDPSTLEHWAAKAAELLKLLHATEMPAGTFPDARANAHEWVDIAAPVLSEDERARLHRLYDEMPEADTLVHGDFHAGNLIVQGDELVLIDTDEVAQGLAVIDLAGMSLVFERIEKDETALAVVGMTVEEMRSFFHALLVCHYGTDDEEILRRHAMERTLHSPVKMLYGLVKTDSIPEGAQASSVAKAHGGLMQLLDTLGM